LFFSFSASCFFRAIFLLVHLFFYSFIFPFSSLLSLLFFSFFFFFLLFYYFFFSLSPFSFFSFTSY